MVDEKMKDSERTSKIGQKKLAIIGNGRLARIVVDAYKNKLLEGYQITGIMGRKRNSDLVQDADCTYYSTLEGLLGDKPDYVLEVAGITAVKQYALDILNSDAQLIVMSTGAFADSVFYRNVKQCALQHNTKIHLVSGAIGGFDIMRTISLMGGKDTEVGISIKKPVSTLYDSPLYKKRLEHENIRVFHGPVAEAIQLLPGQVNVAVSASLATMGPDDTIIDIDSIKDLEEDVFEINVSSQLASVKINIISRPHISSGWAIVARLQNLISPIVF